MTDKKINTAHIINIGDEILSGHTVNTNSSYIASMLYDAGIFTSKIIVIPDSGKEIILQLEESLKSADLIFMTGGLGPTNDDLTKKVICDHLGYKLKFRDDVWEHVKDLFAKRNMIPDEVNREQALFPDSEDVLLILNKTGTAPGIHIRKNGRHIFIMPGVPSEMRNIMSEQLLPFLKENFSDNLYYRDINTSDISESSLYAILSNDPLFPFDCAIAFLPQGYGVTVRIKNFGKEASRKDHVDKAAAKIESLVRNKIFAYDLKTPQHELAGILNRKKYKIAAAESCTGGLFMSNLTNVPGASKIFSEGYVTYSNESKFKTLSVSPHTLGINGAVSEETVSEMLDGLLAISDADIVCAVSGIAGPDGGSERKPVGTVFMGFCLRKEKTKVINKFYFTGDRVSVKEKASNKLMIEIIKHLREV